MKMLTNRNALLVKLNLITMPEQTIKVSECQPTTVWRIVVQMCIRDRFLTVLSMLCCVYGIKLLCGAFNDIIAISLK